MLLKVTMPVFLPTDKQVRATTILIYLFVNVENFIISFISFKVCKKKKINVTSLIAIPSFPILDKNLVAEETLK